MLLGARTQLLSREMNYEEMFRHSKACGVQAFEYCCEDINANYLPETAEDYMLAHIKELSQKYDIQIAAVGNHRAFAQSAYYFEEMKKMIPKVRSLGTDIFIISSNIRPGSENGFKLLYPEVFDTYKKRLRVLLDLAQEHGVKLALEAEPPGFVTSTKETLALMDEMQSDALCVNFDIGHAFLTDCDLLESVRQFGDRIVHAHIENMIRGEHLHRLLDDGDIDLKACLAQMQAVGFNGSVAIDLYIYNYPDVLKQSIDTLRTLLP